MATMMTREAWTDERLDDLNKRVDDGFREMREEFRAGRGELAAMREEIRAVHRELGTFRTEVSQQLVDQQRTMLQVFGGMFAAFAIGFLGVVVSILVGA